MYYKKHGRYWAVIDKKTFDPKASWDEYSGLVAVVLYKKGAEEIVKRLNELSALKAE